MIITHVVNVGSFLKIYGQQNKQDVLSITEAIHEVGNWSHNVLPPPQLSQMVLDMVFIVLVPSENGNNFCRATLIAVDQNGVLKVNLIDSGHVTETTLPHVNNLDKPL